MKSLENIHSSIDTNKPQSKFKKILAFFGPAYLISVGYMDPGNWATDIAGGSAFGYKLLWVLALSNIVAILLQSLSARLGIVYGKDLAQASREAYPPLINYILYALAELAIAATDLAEVIGMAIGLNLLFHIPLLYGVLLTVLDTFLLLFLLNFGLKKLEAFIIALVCLIGFSFLIQLFIVQPDGSEILKGFVPSSLNSSSLYIAMGIIGATVMPHNLYLHSSLVQSRIFKRDHDGIKKAIRFNFFDSVIALNLALFVNAAILIVAAGTFFTHGKFEIQGISQAHEMLKPLLGNEMAPILFAVALIAAGQSSTITGTLAGQIVMEGYLNLRFQPWVRRLLTRLLAVVPAVICILYFGEAMIDKLLVFSQVFLSIQLAFAVIPLIYIVSDKTKLKEFAISIYTKFFAWLAAALIILLNLKLVYETLKPLLADDSTSILFKVVIVIIAIILFSTLIYLLCTPIFNSKIKKKISFHDTPSLLLTDVKAPNIIAVTVDFSDVDNDALSAALRIGGMSTVYQLIHVVETPNAIVYGDEGSDAETLEDLKHLEYYKQELEKLNYTVEINLKFGSPKLAIPEVVKEKNCEMLIMASHGHTGFYDYLFGTTIEAVRHSIHVPLMIV